MIRNVLKKIFIDSQLAPEEEIDEIIEMFVEDEIDLIPFGSNLKVLAIGTTIRLNEEKIKPTPSIKYFTDLLARAHAIPLWFYAAYPDVIAWYNKLRAQQTNDNDVKNLITKAFSIEPTINDEQLYNSRNMVKTKYLKNLVEHYKKEKNLKLEVSITDFKNNIYLGMKFLSAIGTESNFTLVAENVAKFYLELTSKYKNRFTTEYSILAVAGILDAQNYIFILQTISPQEIIDIAQKTASLNEESLINFIIELEIKLFAIDNPDMDMSEVRNGCIAQRETILKAVNKIKDEYVSDPLFEANVRAFMNSFKLKPLRKLLGIKNRFLFF
jgi:hypothetical protein